MMISSAFILISQTILSNKIMAAYRKMTKVELNKLYSKPHYCYSVVSDDVEVFWSIDKKEAEKVFNETNGMIVELVQLKNGNYLKLIDYREIE